MTSLQTAERMMTLFAGFSRASGTHGTPERDPNGLKWSIKKTAKTLPVGPSVKLWEQHIAGKRPLGVVPICDDASCVWGSIDIDRYDIDLLDVVARVETMKLPLLPCRSKSGGLHLFMFTSEPVPAAEMRNVLGAMATSLGFGDSEIFPKQAQIQADRDDKGSWMVMPYYGDTFGERLQLQYGLKKTGAEMTVEEFLSAAEKMRVTQEQMAELLKKNKSGESSARSKPHRLASDPAVPFGDGPPCLQTLAESGFPEGGRNNALFHVGVYRRKSHPDNWEDLLEKDNQKFMRPPLPSEEVAAVKRSLKKKDYDYLCKQQPMCGACDPQTCGTRRFGVGELDIPIITNSRVIESEDPVWFITIAGSNREMRLTDIRDFTDYKRFTNQCAQQLRMGFMPVKPSIWAAVVKEALTRMTPETPSNDTTKRGIFNDLFQNFLTNRRRGHAREDLLRGAPWLDEDKGLYYFKLRALMDYLDKEKMRDVTTHQCVEWIKELGGTFLDDMRLGNATNKRIRNVWRVPAHRFEETPEIPPPPLPPEAI